MTVTILGGYDILAAILRRKAHLINLTAFESLFEFFGLNFNVPEQSTIINPVAYKVIALDFSLWAKTGAAHGATASVTDDSYTKLKPVEYKHQIQRVHLDHFKTLLCSSQFRAFNWSVGFSGGSSAKQEKDNDKGAGQNVSLVRRILFAMQMGWYNEESEDSDDSGNTNMTNYLIDTLGIALRAPGGFERDDIKAVVSYIAANLSEGEFALFWLQMVRWHSVIAALLPCLFL